MPLGLRPPDGVVPSTHPLVEPEQAAGAPQRYSLAVDTTAKADRSVSLVTGALPAAPTLEPPSGASGLATPRLFERIGHQLHALLPDGYGVTLRITGESAPRLYRDPKEAERIIRALPAGSIASVVFYGHGAPGFITVGPDYALGAGDTAELLRGKMARNGEVHFFGCNTASIGSQPYGVNPLKMVFYGLSTLARRLTYFSAPVLLEDADKTTMEGQWDSDLAAETSRALPGVRVTGFRTFAFPADRLLPGSASVTPSSNVLGLSVTYSDAVEIDE